MSRPQDRSVPSPKSQTATPGLTTTAASDMGKIVLLVSLALNGFLVGCVFSHALYWTHCPVCCDHHCCRP